MWPGYEVMWPVCRRSGRAGGVFCSSRRFCDRSRGRCGVWGGGGGGYFDRERDP